MIIMIYGRQHWRSLRQRQGAEPRCRRGAHGMVALPALLLYYTISCSIYYSRVDYVILYFTLYYITSYCVILYYVMLYYII